MFKLEKKLTQEKISQQQIDLRERAKSNPYVASTLLGGLGSAGLL